MEIKGKIDSHSRFYLTIALDDLYDFTEVMDKPLTIKLAPVRANRSLDSNAYFHVLCDKLRQVLNISMARCKNHLIADYGQIEYVEDQPVYIKTTIPEERMIEREEIHTKCVRVAEENGQDVYFYRIYRGSHTYNTKEMAQLIEGTIQECKEQGIETATPAELKQMAILWETKNNGKK